MTVRHKLLGSKAEKVRYCFVNSAQQSSSQEGEAEQKGVHFSCEKIGDSNKKTNIFLPTEEALRLFIGLRDSLRHVIDESSENEKIALHVLVERDAWGMARYTGRKSHVVEDLGL